LAVRKPLSGSFEKEHWKRQTATPRTGGNSQVVAMVPQKKTRGNHPWGSNEKPDKRTEWERKKRGQAKSATFLRKKPNNHGDPSSKEKTKQV